MSALIMAGRQMRARRPEAGPRRLLPGIRRFAGVLIRDESAVIADYANWFIGLGASVAIAGLLWTVLPTAFQSFSGTQLNYMTTSGAGGAAKF